LIDRALSLLYTIVQCTLRGQFADESACEMPQGMDHARRVKDNNRAMATTSTAALRDRE
jgi:hypothetical protein